VDVPVLAIGGVSVERARAIVDAGGAGVAAIGLFLDPTASGCRSVNLNEIVVRLKSFL
jgi:thiamine monophosphate synthase